MSTKFGATARGTFFLVSFPLYPKKQADLLLRMHLFSVLHQLMNKVPVGKLTLSNKDTGKGPITP